MEPMENIRLILAQNIKSRRKLLKINQEDLAEKSGLSLTYVKNIERGVSWPSPESFEALSKGLGVTIGELLNESVSNVRSLPMSQSLKRALKVPDKIYELAERIDLDNDVWDAIEGLLEDEIEYGQKEKGKAKA